MAGPVDQRHAGLGVLSPGRIISPRVDLRGLEKVEGTALRMLNEGRSKRPYVLRHA